MFEVLVKCEEDGKLEKVPRLGVGVAMAGPSPLLVAGHCIPMLPCEGTGRPAVGSSRSLPASTLCHGCLTCQQHALVVLHVKAHYMLRMIFMGPFQLELFYDSKNLFWQKGVLYVIA